MKDNDLRSISELECGNHLCCLYETEEEQLAQLAPFILKGLSEREKVIYYADPFSSERLLENWQTEFPAVAQAFKEGRMSLLTDQATFIRDGSFSPDRTISSLRLLEKRALAEGFAGLRVAAETSWMFGGMTDSALYLELESKLSLYLPISRCALLMQYDRWVFDPAILLDVLAAHPVAVSGSEVYENIYHMLPEELLRRDITSTSLRLWLANLKSNQRESKMLRDSENNFRGIFNAVNDAIFIQDIETFDFVDANQKALEMFGMTLEEIQESPPGFLSCDETSIDREKSLSILDKAAGGEPQAADWMARDRDGRTFWAESNVRRAVIGGEVRLVSTVRDISKRKRAEEALRETRDYLDSLITYANAPIIVWDPERKITRFNHAFEHLAGYAEDEVTGRDLELLFPEGSRQESLGRIGEALSGEQWESVEIPILTKDGKTRVALWNSANIYDSSGTLLATIAQGQDISERKLAEEALRASEANFRGVFNAVAEAIIIRDIEDYHIVDANRKAQEMFGYSLEELRRGPVDINSSGGPGYDDEAVRRILKRAAEGDPQATMWKAKHKDGHTFWVESNITPAEIDGKKRLVGTVRDVSWRKEAEEALRLSEERYRELVENANSIILRWNGQGKITFFNQYAQRFFGYSEGEVLGKSVLMLVPETESDGRDLSNILEDIIEHPDEYAYNENENVCKNGERVWVAWTNKVVKDGTGNAVEIMVVGVDITERKRMERELQAINQELGAYAHTISHDLRAPLSTVHGYTQLALEAYSDGDEGAARESLGAILKLTERMMELANSLLERAEVGKGAGEARRAALDEVLEGVLVDHQGEIRARDIEVAVPEQSPTLLVDPVRLGQVLTNVIGNAIKSTVDEAEPRIRIGAREGGNAITLYVEDNGMGIDPELKEKIFEPFQSFTGGKGVGLSTAKKVVEGWGGRLWVESEPGKGSAFFFTVPAGQEQA
jgi:PAS domain S-box-containing protein